MQRSSDVLRIDFVLDIETHLYKSQCFRSFPQLWTPVFWGDLEVAKDLGRHRVREDELGGGVPLLQASEDSPISISRMTNPLCS